LQVKVPDEHFASFPALNDPTSVCLWCLKKKGDTEMSPITYKKIRNPLKQSFSKKQPDNDLIFDVKQERAKETVELLTDFSKIHSPDW
jgi:hypothetical protein